MKTEIYSSLLPRPIYKTTACQKLDINGNRCENRALFEVFYFGDPSVYDEGVSPTWVCVKLCEDCAGDLKIRDN